jgi:thiol-disulfide isomerase/thioredoxin
MQALLLALWFVIPFAHGSERITNSMILRPYAEAEYQKAVNANQLVLLVFSKPDCPGCIAQVPVIKRLMGEEKYRSVLVQQINFMEQKDLVQKFQAPGWSFLVLKKGNKEIHRGGRMYSEPQIRSFLDRGFP